MCLCCTERWDRDSHKAVPEYCPCKLPICVSCYNRLDNCPQCRVSCIPCSFRRFNLLTLIQQGPHEMITVFPGRPESPESWITPELEQLVEGIEPSEPEAMVNHRGVKMPTEQLEAHRRPPPALPSVPEQPPPGWGNKQRNIPINPLRGDRRWTAPIVNSQT